MTVLVSFASENIIVMCADSAVTNYFTGDQGDYREYDQGAKILILSGIGVVSTWGDRTRNRIFQFLREQNIRPETHSVEDLRDLVRDYLQNHLQPRENDMDEVGFHVGGFDRDGAAKLYHIFWGCNRPRLENEIAPAYHQYDHSDKVILYNGRNDLAFTVVSAFISQIKTRSDTRYDITTLRGLIRLCDLVVRFSAEITPEVGPPFNYLIISPDRTIHRLTNSAFSPIIIEPDDPIFQIDQGNYPLVMMPEEPIMMSPIFVLPSGIKLSEELLRERYLFFGSSGGTILPLG